MGLGAVWTGAYPSEERSNSIKKVLSLPDNLIPLNMVVIGYPAEHPQPKDKFKEAIYRTNRSGDAPVPE